LTWSTPGRIIREDQTLLDEAARKDASFLRPVPQKAYVSTNVVDVGEDLETYQDELALVRRIGSTSAPNDLGRLNNKRSEFGLDFGWALAPGFIPIPRDRNFDAKAAAAYVANAYNKNPVPRKTVIMLKDEPVFAEIEKNAALDARMRTWMKAKGLTPADAGCASWDDVKVIAPSPTSKRLSVISRNFQVDQTIQCFNGFASAFDAVDPNYIPAVNWGMLDYMDGLKLDLWEMYKQPGFGVVWAEDWYGYEPPGAGAIAWYADLMRSQQKYRSLPMGTYPIVGWGYGPTLTTMKYYERMMRGCTMFETYSYSPRGNQVSWLEQPETILTLARLHRDLAEVEDILVGGKVLPAKVALLYPNSSTVWDPIAPRAAQGLYTALLQAGIPVDILTEQDLVDGYAKGYKMILGVGRNIRPDALSALDNFIQAGGNVVWSAPDIRDEYDEPIAKGAEIFGAKSLVNEVSTSPGRWLYELPKAKAIDTVKWGGKGVSVYSQKSKIEPLATSQIVATFSDGSPAIIKTPRGKGTVYLYGFAPGFSYMKADFNGDNTALGTALSANDNERDLATFPAKNIANAIKVSAPMVSARAVTNGAAAFVGLVDYGIGAVGRATKNLPQKSVDLQAMNPYPITLTIACTPKPKKVYGVRSGAVSWKYANGAVQVQVPLRGVDMIVLNGTQLTQ
jgi:hypothetical protein